MKEFTVVDGLDLGLFSDHPASVAFYEEQVGLAFVETLRHSPTYEERFYSVGGSSLKINYSTDPMPKGSSGYCGLTLARDGITDEIKLIDPDGLAVTLTPSQRGPGARVAITCAVADVDRQARFLMDGLGAKRSGQSLRIGRTLIDLTETNEALGASPTWSRGFNYVVAFVDDVQAAHAALIGFGAEHSVPPIRLADRCVFSWLRDPSGNWLELVQPATGGPLPEVAPIEHRWQEIIAWRESGVAFS